MHAERAQGRAPDIWLEVGSVIHADIGEKIPRPSLEKFSLAQCKQQTGTVSAHSPAAAAQPRGGGWRPSRQRPHPTRQPPPPSFGTLVKFRAANENPGKVGHYQHLMTGCLINGVHSENGAGRKAVSFDNEQIWRNQVTASFAYSSTPAVCLFGFCVNFSNCKTQHAKLVD